MKIEKKLESENGIASYWFDNGAWARVDMGEGWPMIDYGSWEFQADEHDAETYMEGGLWIEGEQVVDYDGCYELPEEVKMALTDLGYVFEDKDKRL